MKTLISCTWHSNKDRKVPWSKRIYEAGYLRHIRFPHIAKQIDNYISFVYVSNTNNDVLPIIGGEPNDPVTLYGQEHDAPKHHDSFARPLTDKMKA